MGAHQRINLPHILQEVRSISKTCNQLNLLYLWRNLFFSNQLRVQWSSNRATRCAGIGGALGVLSRICHTDTTSPCTAGAARRVRAAACRQVTTADPEGW